MNIHVLQHVPFEDVGSMRAWLVRQADQLTYTRFYYEDATLPDPSVPDLMVVMGGPMSVNDEASCPWLAAEKAFLRRVIERGGAVVGVCLGSQLIASALGARVYRAARKEIGWFPIEAVPVPDGALRFPDGLRVFQWHGDTFDLPEGAVRLARSDAVENQAFQLGEHVIGIQFHLEMTPDTIRALVSNCGSELVPAAGIQTRQELTGEPAASYERAHPLMDAILTRVTLA